jgi:hypothetical protein
LFFFFKTGCALQSKKQPRLQNPAPPGFYLLCSPKRAATLRLRDAGGQRADKKATVPSILSRSQVLDLNNKKFKNLKIGIVILLFTSKKKISKQKK